MKKNILWLALFSASVFSQDISINKEELTHIGELIFKNETGANKSLLVHWNATEAFPSLGIGHFIWYPAGVEEPFDESFPRLIDFYQKNNVTLPALLQKNKDAPWKSAAELTQHKSSPEVQELINFLNNTKDIQIAFIYERMQAALPKMMAASTHPDHVKQQFERLTKTKHGLYPLIDYVNFKGEGIKESEQFNHVGWGLKQVLENMEGTAVGPDALKEFTGSAIAQLAQRPNNSALDPRFKADPSAKKIIETNYLPGFAKRCLTYMGIGL